MTADVFVPVGFTPPTSLTTGQFRLEPLGPQHNQADHAAWMSSIEHIRSTPGYPDGNWPPHSGMTLEENLADLRRHAAANWRPMTPPRFTMCLVRLAAWEDGDSDPLAPPFHGKWFTKHLPNVVEFVVVPGEGHLALMRHWRDMLRVVTQQTPALHAERPEVGS